MNPTLDQAMDKEVIGPEVQVEEFGPAEQRRRSKRLKKPNKLLGDYIWQPGGSTDGMSSLSPLNSLSVAAIGSQLRGPIAETSRSRPAEVVLSSNSSGGNLVSLRHKPASVEVERYFDFYSILPEHQLSLASFYLDGEALEWYRWLFRNKQLVDWSHFAAKLILRFRKKELEDPEGRLAKLRQSSTVADYQSRFEAMANETEDISDSLMMKLFLSGLRLDIKTAVLVHKPKTFDDAISLAQIHEQRLNIEKGPMQPAFARSQPLLPTPQSRSMAPSRHTTSMGRVPIK
ncbi:hypothetical protein KY285_012996 [Solanum tuberosum]|nr:hypothetical protein KY289_013642 [Solanum tuberosum]KAH0716965.1 hypothetical protein KY285_012996 [Solanum tuberosum]